MNRNKLEKIVNDVVQACLAGDRHDFNRYLDPQVQNSSLIETEIIQPIQRVLSEPNASYQLSFEDDYPFTRALIMTDSKQPITPVPLDQQIAAIDIIYDDESEQYFVTLK
ncbi:hypothetical protein [Macrococcus lamae]|uniref:Uncharacterized protein n=1 Tax=Macrococcus lamae TaxID=198484 RepID=A0A4V3BF60_9STAP|nr:hypothetical protein [Macrococcus lamae]TDM12771.1 hypothetical protein ERX29_01850 [Macrococcus lamae]